MYKISKPVKMVEKIELEDGVVLDVTVNVGKIADNFNRIYNAVLTQQKQKSDKLGSSVIEMLELVLGDSNTKTLLEYYDGDWLELMLIIVPFIELKFLPLVKEHQKKKREDAKMIYKASKNA